MKFSNMTRIVSKGHIILQPFMISVSVAALSFAALIIMAIIEFTGMPHRTISANLFLVVVTIFVTFLLIGHKLGAHERPH